MKTYLYFSILCFTALSNASCIHYYYAPNTNNVPLFKEKNEARVQANYSIVNGNAENARLIDGFEMQSAYAVGKHTALQLNFFHAGDKNDYGSGKGNYIEAAGGYFKPLQKNNNWIFETYAGMGIGGVNSFYGSNSETAKTSITKFFIQPSFGYSSEYFDIAVSSKFSIVDIGVNSSSLTKEYNSTDFDYMQSLKNGNSYFWWEPGFMIRGGFKQIKAFFQFTYSLQSYEALPYSRDNFSVGAIIFFKVK